MSEQAVKIAMEQMLAFDPKKTGLVENEGFPDQTYDVWKATGPSSYTGGLYLAALSAAAVLAFRAGDVSQALQYARRLKLGRSHFESTLWSESCSCYKYDASGSPHHDSIMADQLAGQWYARACGLPTLLNPARVQRALLSIFHLNVKQFCGGQAGAVNVSLHMPSLPSANTISQLVSFSVAAYEGLIRLICCRECDRTVWSIDHRCNRKRCGQARLMDSLLPCSTNLAQSGVRTAIMLAAMPYGSTPSKPRRVSTLRGIRLGTSSKLQKPGM